MSRIVSNTVDYFPHFTKHGKTLFILKGRFGNDGYAFWFQLLELLSQSEDHFWDCRKEEDWQYLLSFCGSNDITGTEILSLLAKLGNIDPELWQERLIWCQALVNNFSDIYKKRGRKIPSKPVIDTRNGITGDNNGITGTEMPQSIVKEIIVKESTVNKERKLSPFPEFSNVSMTQKEIDELKTKFGDDGFKERVEGLSLYMKSKGKAYKDHYATILTWARKDAKEGLNNGNGNGNGRVEVNRGVPGNRPAGAFADIEGD